MGACQTCPRRVECPACTHTECPPPVSCPAGGPVCGPGTVQEGGECVPDLKTYVKKSTYNALLESEESERKAKNARPTIAEYQALQGAKNTCDSNLDAKTKAYNTCDSTLTAKTGAYNTCDSNLDAKTEAYNTCDLNLTEMTKERDARPESCPDIHPQVLVKWGEGKRYMSSCDDFTKTVGPYKDSRGKWLVNDCWAGYSGTNCNTINHSTSSTTSWGQLACDYGKKLKQAEKDCSDSFFTKTSETINLPTVCYNKISYKNDNSKIYGTYDQNVSKWGEQYADSLFDKK